MALNEWEQYLEEQWRARGGGQAAPQQQSLEERLAALERELQALQQAGNARQGAHRMAPAHQGGPVFAQPAELHRQPHLSAEDARRMTHPLPGGLVVSPYVPAQPAVIHPAMMRQMAAMPRQATAAWQQQVHQQYRQFAFQSQFQQGQMAGGFQDAQNEQQVRRRAQDVRQPGQGGEEAAQGGGQVVQPQEVQARNDRVAAWQRQQAVAGRSPLPPRQPAERPAQQQREDPNVRQLRLELRRLGEQLTILRREMEARTREWEAALAGD